MPTPTSAATDRPSASPPRRDRHGGFTLIELVLALAILSLVAALALPSARPGGGQALLRIRASEVVALLRADRNAALRTGRTVVSRLDLAGRRLYAGGSAQVLVLPPRVRLRVSPDGLDGFRFSADGQSSGGGIALGERIAVTVNPLTAAIQVERR